MKITREIKTAILVIASILLFIWGYSFLKGKDLFTDYKKLYVDYENVEGLSIAAPVTLNGLIIGKVNNMIFSNNSGKVTVELQIKSDFPISKSSIASIYESGLIGGKQIMIVPNLTDKTIALSGSRIMGQNKLGLTDMVGEKLQPLQEKLDKVLQNVDNLLLGINTVLNKEGQNNLSQTLEELNKTMQQFHQASIGLNQIVEGNKLKVGAIVTDFNKVSHDFAKISDSLNKADLGRTAKNLQLTLAKVDKIMEGLQSGKGTMGKLLNDEALYNNLSKTSKELELLLQDVRLYPTRYVNVSLFGKKNKPYKSPTNDSIMKINN